MVEIINVRGNSVRIRSGIFVVDIIVYEDETHTRRIKLHKGAYFITPEDMKKLVSAVLTAFEKSMEKEKSIEYVTSEITPTRTSV